MSLHPLSLHRLAPIIAAVEREASGWFGVPVDAVTPEQHVQQASSEHLLLRVRTRTRTAGVSVRVWRVMSERPQERRRVEERVRREFQATMNCWRAFVGMNTVGCVRPLGYFPEHLAIATEEAPGRPLAELLERVLLPFASRGDRAMLDRACRGVADWLRQFHRMGNDETISDAATLTDYVDVRLRRLVANPMAGFTEADRVRVLLVAAWLIARLQPGDFAELPIHGELSPAKISLDDTHLTVLDCNLGRRGLLLHDLASIYMHIGLFASDNRYSASLIREVQRRFLTAFDSTLDAHRPALRVALLVNVVNHYSSLAAQRTASIAALSDWRVMRRHRAWLRRLESVAHGAAAAR